ncbi:hypothetical protein GCM10010918_52630 [Paenibacillus radicis (ex Gao et al. 2016)]|uniref:Uncharacterized protein n=1 Tax=Paenibacillus radicis (ex Gao et al. 2016) TaxID=1737354 RepID=A0A917M9F5_9BACL|nr:hypothetical protein GCM10010918_52630 [Paenibacillus radicis (ex Gao et al. 2016)]
MIHMSDGNRQILLVRQLTKQMEQRHGVRPSRHGGDQGVSLRPQALLLSRASHLLQQPIFSATHSVMYLSFK